MNSRMESQHLSDETTGLLLMPERQSLELGTFSSSLLEDDSVSTRMLPQRQKPPLILRTGFLVGIFLCGIAIRLLGFSSSTNTLEIQTTFVTATSTTSYWDDERHQGWQDYLAARRSPSMASSLSAGSLLGSNSALSTESTTSTISSSSSSSNTNNLLYFNQTIAFAKLDPMQADFFHYQNGWEAQITQALCAIATTAALLNSLRDVGPQFELPMDPTYKPFLWATQANILGSAETDSCVVEALGGSIYNRDAVYHMGLGLTMVPRLANCFLAPNGYEATAHPGVASEEASIKAIVLEALRDPSKRVIYNYDRGGIGQGPMGHGHWSPLGGYHEATDSFLVMDVAKYKHPMVWVPWDNLWSGATTVDSCGETLELDEVVDWSLGYSRLIGYLSSRCIPGNRGFVVVQPTDGEL